MTAEWRLLSPSFRTNVPATSVALEVENPSKADRRRLNVKSRTVRRVSNRVCFVVFPEMFFGFFLTRLTLATRSTRMSLLLQS
jgi:hypothetical protein